MSRLMRLEYDTDRDENKVIGGKKNEHSDSDI